MASKNTTKDGRFHASVRVWRALVMLLLSMTAGAAALMMLGGNPPSAGAFCLSSYYMLAATDKIVGPTSAQSWGRWSHIEICYSGTRTSNRAGLARAAGVSITGQLPYHFIVCNGLEGQDGQILPTPCWDQQRPVGKRADTIRICIVADGKSTYPTDAQIKRVECLIDTLCRRLQIPPERVYYSSELPGRQG